MEREKKELSEEFHRLVYEVHQKTGLRNLILEKKHETIQESLETKDAQINQLLAAARIDPQALGVIRSTLEEVENLKSDAIREIQASLKKIREAHSNMVKTYEGKLSEFGIPVEELGFDPLVPANIWSKDHIIDSQDLLLANYLLIIISTINLSAYNNKKT